MRINAIEETKKLQNDQLELMMGVMQENESLKSEIKNMKKWTYILLKHLGGSVDIPDKVWGSHYNEQEGEVKVDVSLPDKVKFLIVK